MSKINYAIISAEEYLRNLAKETTVEDNKRYEQLILDRSSEVCDFQYKIGHVLEIKGERLVCDLFENEEENKVSGLNLWGYITHLYGSGLILVDIFYIPAAESSIMDLVENLLNTVSYDFNHSGDNFEMLGNLQITVEFDEESNSWIGLDEAEMFIQELPKVVKSSKVVKKIIDKFLNNE